MQRLLQALYDTGQHVARRAATGNLANTARRSVFQSATRTSTKASVRQAFHELFVRAPSASVDSLRFSSSYTTSARSHISKATRGTSFRPSVRYGVNRVQLKSLQSPLNRSTAHSLGLQSARNFSSSTPIFSNIVQNVPIGMRAVADRIEYGLDQRKLRKTVKLEHMAQRLAKAQTLVKPLRYGMAQTILEIRKDVRGQVLNDYFVPEVVTEDKVPSIQSRLVLPMMPAALDLDVEIYAPDEGLIPSRALGSFRDFQERFTVHQARIRGIFERLFETGLEPVVNPTVDEFGRILIDLECTVTDVRQALGLWPGQKLWFQIIDMSTPEEYTNAVENEHDQHYAMEASPLTSPSNSPVPHSNSSLDTQTESWTNADSQSDMDDTGWHQEVTSTFIMPSLSLGANFLSRTSSRETSTSDGTLTDSLIPSEFDLFESDHGEYHRGIREFIMNIPQETPNSFNRQRR